MEDRENSLYGDDIPGIKRQSADGTLIIVVCRAKHLPNRRKLDKQSPYVTLRLGTTAKKTKSHFRAGQTPEWTEEIRFELSREKKPLLKVDVLDETKNDPTPIGGTEIDCSVIFAEERRKEGGKYIFDDWYDLKLNGRRAGMIYLEMTFYPSAPILPPKQPMLQSYQSQYSLDHHQEPVHEHNHSFYGEPNEHFPLPPVSPRHPPQNRTKNVTDDIFVSSNGSGMSSTLKRLSFLKNSQSTTNTSPMISAKSSFEEERPNELVDEKSGGIFKNRFNKLKSKFQSKEPLHALWVNHKKDELTIDVNEIENDDFYKGNLYNIPGEVNRNFLLGIDDPSDDDLEESNIVPPPPPPPHVVSLDQSLHQIKESSPTRSHKSPSRKPPPGSNELAGSFNKMSLSRNNIPFSADSIGLQFDQDDIHNNVYKMNKYQARKNGKVINPDEIDPKYYAPSPSDELARTLRLQNGTALRQDLAVDLRTEETGYMGDGKFSPSVFEKLNFQNQECKPMVPPKIPKGLSEREYYLLDKENYMRDISGQRL